MSHTIGDIDQLISDRLGRLATHSLFAKLNTSADIGDLRVIGPQAYFLVLGFQDMLRIAHERISDPAMKEIAGGFREDDAEHEQWFLGDMEALGTVRDVAWIFGPAHAPVRDTVYGLLGELVRAETDPVRLVVPLIWERTAAVFFGPAIGVTRRTQFPNLRYFAPVHEEAEADHGALNGGQARLMAIEMDASEYAYAQGVVDRSVALFGVFADFLSSLLPESGGDR